MGILDDAIREHLELKRAHGASDEELKYKEAEAFGPIRQEAPATPDSDRATEMLRPDDIEDELHAAPGVHPDPNATHVAEPASADVDSLEPAAENGPPTEHHEVDALEPAAEDPYKVHPGDSPVPDPHEHGRTGGADPAYREDTDFFTDEAEEQASPAAAEAGAGTLEPGDRGEPGPPIAPDHHADEQHPALHDHDAIHSEEHAPEPVFRREAESAPPDAPLEPSPIEDPPVGDPPVEHPEIDEPPPRQSSDPADPADEDVLEETPEFLQDAPEHDRLWFEQKPPRDFDFGE